MQKTGVVLHAACVMSNHLHLVVTDPRGLLPDFLREVHRLTAKAMNALQGKWESLWAAEPCNAVRLVTDIDIEDKIAYVVANPVAAGLVEQPREWPGLVAWGESSRRVVRPTSYFRAGGTCPPEIELRLEAPLPRDPRPGLPRDWKKFVGQAIEAKVEAAQASLRRAGERRFRGRAAVQSAPVNKQARSEEKRFGVTPTFAAKAQSVRESLRRVERQFRMSYRVALEGWRSGLRDIPFPFGTWGMVVFHAAVVEPRTRECA
jgi:REP element-mobilizing transposase RayT